MPKKKGFKRSSLLFTLGGILIGISLLFYANETIQLAFFTPHVTKVRNTQSLPTHMSIPSIYLEQDIFETALHNNVWEIAPQGASHLTISARPGENGPIIVYGHNTNDRFGPIRWLTPGKEIIITTADNKQHTYTITKTEEVASNQTTELTNVGGETLILYTCDGFADLQRFLVFATPNNTH